MNVKRAKKEKTSGITIRELTIIGLLAGITIALGLSGYGIIPLRTVKCNDFTCTNSHWCYCRSGQRLGAFVGFIFGCYSLWQNITAS
ncbi:MAG: hypothetical protein ACLUPK_03540 [Veillonella sp.]